jgi:hypothetical protein
MGHRDGLDTAEREKKSLSLPGLELRLLIGPVRSQSLHLMRYPVSLCKAEVINNLHTSTFNLLARSYNGFPKSVPVLF